ncbi:MAG TPA: hypothetical protein VKU02_04745 [Gemmataceae bacterium]|nr:hypothetical protein [Gemmataceae bacterium]
MNASKKHRQPRQAWHEADTATAPSQQEKPKEQVFEEGQNEQNDPRPTPEKLSGTPIGSDPRE